MEYKKITFVLGKFPNPRMKKRIELEKRIGSVSLICWNMGSVNYDYYDKEVELVSIDIKANRTNPLKRIIPTIKFMYKSIKKLFEISPEILHVENVDMLFVGTIYYLLKRKKPRIVYEVADLHNLIINEPNTLKRKMIKQILVLFERKMCRVISLLIITSERFYDVYYKEFIDSDKVVFMPNMPELKVFKYYEKKEKGRFTIGFVGSIRYYDQMKLLIEASNNKGIDVIFAGFTHNKEFQSEFADKQNVSFLGKYDYDKDISNIYKKLDCVYSVYNADDNNVKVALPNKLYEAIYCELPIIVASGTYLSELVSEMGVGVSVYHKSLKELEIAIDELVNNTELYESIVRNCKIHKERLNINMYNSKLITKIKGL